MADRNGYIGRAPSDSAVTVARQTFSPTGVTTNFTFSSGYTVGYLDLFLNGAKLIEGVDYTATDTSTISLVSAAINGDVLEGVAYKAFNLGDANRIGIQSAGTLVGNVNTLNFVGAGNSILLNGGTIDVSISGGGGAGVGGTWGNYDGVTGVTTTKKVKIQNNLEVTGVTTSTGGFVGALTGNVTGTVSGNAGSATVLAASRNIGGVAFNGSGDINLPGVNQSGTQNTSGTAAGLSGTPNITIGNLVGVAATFTGVLTYEDVTNIDSLGIVTARTGIKVLAGGINAVGVVTATGGVQVGAGQSFGANGPTAVYYGNGSNLTNLPAAGLTTEALVSSGIVTTLNLTAAQDHKVTASGITTITCSGGTEADSHTVRIINSGITTVGFSTYFLFPSGSTPSLPTANGAISLISFTVNRVGAGGTQLLAGASVNYS
jgi:hypothetical protein